MDVSQGAVLARPLQAAAPDPSLPTMTPQQAQMQTSTLHPDHQEKQCDIGVTFDQSVRGVEIMYKRWYAAKAAYSRIRAILAGEQVPPTVPFPTGETDENGELMIYEIDVNATLPRGVSEEERMTALERQLGPWNNYLVREYARWITKLAQFAMEVSRMMNSGQTQEEVPAAPHIAIPPVPTE